jgi:hypothetical protein
MCYRITTILGITMSLDLTNYPSNENNIPDDWKWWECSSCGDYAWVAPEPPPGDGLGRWVGIVLLAGIGSFAFVSWWKNQQAADHSSEAVGPTVEKDTKVIMLTIREYETLIKQCFSDIAVKAAESRDQRHDHGIDYQECKLLEIIEIAKRAQELITISKE